MDVLIKELEKRYPILATCADDISTACSILINSIESGGKLLLCGNGGSAADCEHISGELLKGFLSERPISDDDKKSFECFENGGELAEKLQYGIPALPLMSFSSLYTAFCNDVDPDAVFAQLVMALGRPGDVLIGITTSGSAVNVRNAAITARTREMSVIGLTGQSGGALASLSNCCIKVPEIETFKVQELHLPVYHYICAVLEKYFFVK